MIFVLSLAMTDHYFDLATMKQMGAAVKEGKPPHLLLRPRKVLSGISNAAILDPERTLARYHTQEDEFWRAR